MAGLALNVVELLWAMYWADLAHRRDQAESLWNLSSGNSKTLGLLGSLPKAIQGNRL